MYMFCACINTNYCSRQNCIKILYTSTYKLVEATAGTAISHRWIKVHTGTLRNAFFLASVAADGSVTGKTFHLMWIEDRTKRLAMDGQGDEAVYSTISEKTRRQTTWKAPRDDRYLTLVVSDSVRSMETTELAPTNTAHSDHQRCSATGR